MRGEPWLLVRSLGQGEFLDADLGAKYGELKKKLIRFQSRTEALN